MKIDIRVALLAYLRAKDCGLCVKDFENLLVAINDQMSENEMQTEIEKYLRINFSQYNKICVDKLKSKGDNSREENFTAESNY